MDLNINFQFWTLMIIDASIFVSYHVTEFTIIFLHLVFLILFVTMVSIIFTLYCLLYSMQITLYIEKEYDVTVLEDGDWMVPESNRPTKEFELLYKLEQDTCNVRCWDTDNLILRKSRKSSVWLHVIDLLLILKRGRRRRPHFQGFVNIH